MFEVANISIKPSLGPMKPRRKIIVRKNQSQPELGDQEAQDLGGGEGVPKPGASSKGAFWNKNLACFLLP